MPVYIVKAQPHPDFKSKSGCGCILNYSQYPYFLRFAIRKTEVTIIDIISAPTMDSQIPSISQKIGNKITAAIWKTRVRINDITADVKPSFNAVKKEEPNTEKPDSRKENEKIENAWFVILKSSAS